MLCCASFGRESMQKRRMLDCKNRHAAAINTAASHSEGMRWYYHRCEFLAPPQRSVPPPRQGGSSRALDSVARNPQHANVRLFRSIPFWRSSSACKRTSTRTCCFSSRNHRAEIAVRAMPRSVRNIVREKDCSEGSTVWCLSSTPAYHRRRDSSAQGDSPESRKGHRSR